MTAQILHRIPWSAWPEKNPEVLLDREWLVTNGLGGYASGTVSGACTRRYHGLLIAALPAPFGRYVMFNHLAEEIKLEDRKTLRLDNEDVGVNGPEKQSDWLGEFRVEMGLPVWEFEIGPVPCAEANFATLPAKHGPRDFPRGHGSRRRAAAIAASNALSFARCAGQRSVSASVSNCRRGTNASKFATAKRRRYECI